MISQANQTKALERDTAKRAAWHQSPDFQEATLPTKAHCTEPFMRAAILQKVTDMAFEPKPEPASRPGKKTAIIAAVILIGGGFIVYWSQLKTALNLG
jgi:hypothetical protein